MKNPFVTQFERELRLVRNDNSKGIYKVYVLVTYCILWIWHVQKDTQVELFDSHAKAEGRYLQRASKVAWDAYRETLINSTPDFYDI